MLHLLFAALVIIITEYGFQSRVGIVNGFATGWHPRRTLIRVALWLLYLFATEFAPLSLLLVGMGIALSEMGAIVLRRRMRIDSAKGMPHGYPHTHFIPFIVGIVFVLILSVLLSQIDQTRLLDQTEGFGFQAPLVLFSVVILWGWATMVTVSVVDLVRPGQVRADSEQIGAGEVIGVLERLATFVLVASSAFSAVGFVIAAKAAARFPLFKEKAFAEYFLIGTLTSVGLSLLLGLLFLSGQ